MTNGKKDAYKSISILKKGHRKRKCQVREAAESVPRKIVNPKLFSSAEFSDAKGFLPKYVRMDLPPYHDILGLQCARRVHPGGAGAVEVEKVEQPSSHIDVEITLRPAKYKIMVRIKC